MARNFDLPETKGTFEIRGRIVGTERDGYYTEGTTRGGRSYRTIRFGVEFDANKVVFLELFAMEQDKVFFYNTENKKVIPVEWNKRNSPEVSLRKEGAENARLIGMGLGLTKDENGKNEVQYMVQYDGAEYIHQHLRDGACVYIRGELDFGHFVKDGNVVKTQKLIPQNIYLAQDVDFESEDFEPVANFTQEIVYLGIEKSGDKEAILSANIVNYNTVEEDIFSVTNRVLFEQLKSRLKPYNFIQVHGTITTIANTDAVEKEEEEVWGEQNEMEKVRVPYRRVFLVTGAKPSTLDTETYSLENVSNAINAMNKVEGAVQEFGDDEEEDWGDASLDSEDEAW